MVKKKININIITIVKNNIKNTNMDRTVSIFINSPQELSSKIKKALMIKKQQNYPISMIKIVNMITAINKKTTSTIMLMIMTISTIMKTTGTVTIIQNTLKIKASAWKQLFFTRYVNIDETLADVIQSVGLLISSLFIFFLGSDKGAPV